MSCENCTCAPNGQASSGSLLPDWLYRLGGGITPGDDANIACQYAVDQINAMGLDPNDPANSAMLQMFFGQGLQSNAAVSASEPLTNPIQKAADVAIGTASPSAPVVGGAAPKPASTNYGLIFGALLVFGIGFWLVFRR